MKYDLAVYIGRFQPFHKGHQYVIDEAKKVAVRVLVLAGSSNSSRSIKNPFTFSERRSLIKKDNPDIMVHSLPDYLYEENQWITEVQDIVYEYLSYLSNYKPRVCIIGHSKDESSYYLKNFPQWDQIDLEHWEALDASAIRGWYLSEFSMKFIEGAVSENTFKYLVDFKKTEEYKNLKEEEFFIQDYKKDWAGSPYPPIFVTVDAVVVQSGHILLIQRGNHPGKGQWALPGGFINPKEKLQQSVIRELREETKLKVPVKVLEGSIQKVNTFDYPDRSTRGRTITQAFLFQLDNSQELPKVKGSDDAVYAKWIPLAEFYNMESEMYEDHYHIIRNMIDNS